MPLAKPCTPVKLCSGAAATARTLVAGGHPSAKHQARPTARRHPVCCRTHPNQPDQEAQAPVPAVKCHWHSRASGRRPGGARRHAVHQCSMYVTITIGSRYVATAAHAAACSGPVCAHRSSKDQRAARATRGMRGATARSAATEGAPAGTRGTRGPPQYSTRQRIPGASPARSDVLQPRKRGQVLNVLCTLSAPNRVVEPYPTLSVLCVEL